MRGSPLPFRAVLTPQRSLSRSGFIVLMIVVCGVSLVSGLAFLLVGAWPVLVFFALNVLLIYLAFRLNNRSARLYELIEVTRDRLIVTRRAPSGRLESFEFNPYWVRLRLAEGPNGRNDLRLTLHHRQLSFGRFLTDDERRELADALGAALLAARGGLRC